MKSILSIFIYALICFAGHSQTLPAAGTPEKLFNGKNLNGWYQITDKKGTDNKLFAADNGTIHAYPTQGANSTQSFGAIITLNEFENYVLTLEYKWGEKKFKPRDEFVRDAGVLIHVSGEDVIWPGGIECQVQEGDTGDLWIIKSQASSRVHATNKNFDPGGKLATLGTLEQEYNRFPRSYCWEKPGWNKVALVVKGDHASFYINDKLVNEAIDIKTWDGAAGKWVPLTKGKILLQAEGSEVFYRNIMLQGLKNE